MKETSFSYAASRKSLSSANLLPDRWKLKNVVHRRWSIEVNVVREQKKAVELQEETKIEDLTKGVMLYTRLGLDFERIKDDLWFRFTHLDPKDPLRKFSFSLIMINGDTYQVNAPNPELPKDAILAIVRQLNKASHGS